MSRWRETWKVHPAAEVFPLMEDDELEALGKDITENGLKQPIMMFDAEGGPVVLDGRNRLEAMERAGIKTAKDAVGLRYR
jgi:ParB-like chromosome segregation protein Spo0J